MIQKIEKSSFAFLKALSGNNNRDWFQQNKSAYIAAQENMIAFADGLLQAMQQHDHIETASGKDSLMRIYRDTRFSKDKTPYRTYFGGGFRRATKQLRGGYYFQIGPGVSLAAGGFFSPSPADLLRIRKDIEYHYADWEKILNAKNTVHYFGPLKGEKLSTAPRGFPKDHPAIELLKHKQFYLERTFTDKEVLNDGFLKELNLTFKQLRNYFDHMSEILTTDLNGEPIL